MIHVFKADLIHYNFKAPVLAVSCAIAAFLAGCATGAGGYSGNAESGEINKAGFANTSFTSAGQLINLNFVSIPRSAQLTVAQGRLYFDGEALSFLYVDEKAIVFSSPSSGACVDFSLDSGTGLMSATEVGGLYFRSWKSRAGPAEFERWKQRFAQLGASPNRLGFVAQSKFIDGTRTELRKDDQRVYGLEIEGQRVLWDGAETSLSVVTMENGASAVELKKPGATFWLYGGGNFQINFEGAIKTVIVGSSKALTGAALQGEVPRAYVDFYPRLKRMAAELAR